MAKWQIWLSGDCHPDQLEELQYDLRDAAEPYGVSASQVSTDQHNGPLAGRPKGKTKDKAAE
jgi:hypothetical protein